MAILTAIAITLALPLTAIAKGPMAGAATCREAWSDMPPYRQYALKAWRQGIVLQLEASTGLRLDEASHRWGAVKAGDDLADVGQSAYQIAELLAPAVDLASATGDSSLTLDLAGFYEAYLTRFTSIPSTGAGARSFRQAGDTSTFALMLPSWRARGGRREQYECVLCSAQFLYPVARLIDLAAAQRHLHGDKLLRQFVAAYSPLLVEGHLLRWEQHHNRNYWAVTGLDSALLSAWTQLASPSPTMRNDYRFAVLDVDLWMIGASAEVLAAHAKDSSLVPLSSASRLGLRNLVEKGVAMIRSRRSEHPPIVAGKAGLLGTMDFFEGEFDHLPDMQFARATGAALPASPSPPTNIGWDVSHATRIPEVVNTLRETEPYTRIHAFSGAEIRAIADQYAYRVIGGTPRLPLLRNFMDGSDGWYRVGYHGPTFGYPPSRYCDARDGNRPCLGAFGVVGWGLLADASTKLCSSEISFVQLAQRLDTESRTFADRHYRYQGKRFAFADESGGAIYPYLLFALLSANARFLR